MRHPSRLLTRDDTATLIVLEVSLLESTGRVVGRSVQNLCARANCLNVHLLNDEILTIQLEFGDRNLVNRFLS